MNTTIFDKHYLLANGVKIPKLGLGTWMIDNKDAAEAVRQAARVGYRHFDTAEGYMNEQGVGEGIRTCGLKCEEVFVTTKLDASYKDYDSTQAAIEKSLDDLGLDYIDLFIIHAPQPWNKFRTDDHYFEGNLAAWCAMEKAYKAGRLRAIGVSNFEEVDLDNIIRHADVRPMVNQVLAHVSNMPWKVIDYCRRNDILVEAYSPMGHGEMMKNQTVKAMAERYGVGIARLCIRYCLQQGLLPLPKTSNPQHMQSNARLDFNISAEDMQALDRVEPMRNYGEASIFPVYGGKMDEHGNLTPRDFYNGEKQS